MISKVFIIKSKTKYIPYVLLAICLVIYFFTRLQNLTSLPVFADEAIYIRWSQIIKSVETLRFIPQTDGKQPFFMWLTVPMFKLFSDPLFSGRMVSVMAGSITLISLFLISQFFKLSHKTILFLLLLYCLSPFFFFFDRLALADSLLAMWGVLILYLSLLQGKYLRLDLSLIIGGIIGLAWLTKSPAIFFVALSSLTVILFQSNLKALILSFISSALAFAIYNLLRLGPQFHMIALRNQDYVWKFSDIIKHPLDPLKPHLFDILALYNYFLPFLLLSTIICYVAHLIVNKKNISLNRYFLITFLWWLPPLLANATFAKVFTARYMLYTVTPLLLFLMLIFEKSKLNQKFKTILLIATCIPSLLMIYQISLFPSKLNLPSTETGYVENWTSGWGIKQSAQYLIKRSTEANVIVGTEGYFGTLPDGLQIYTNNIPSLTVFGIGVNISEIPSKLIDAKNYGDEVYLLINTNRLFIPLENLNIIYKYPKPNGTSLLLIRI